MLPTRPRRSAALLRFAGKDAIGRAAVAAGLARALGLKLYRVDLSGVTSRYIGETEKKLNAAFRNAERSGGLLFLDEADALFGKRTSVTDAHNRYGNLDTNYLLQHLERCRGVATSGERSLDPAFQRRILATLRFRKPRRAKPVRRRRRRIRGEGPS